MKQIVILILVPLLFSCQGASDSWDKFLKESHPVFYSDADRIRIIYKEGMRTDIRTEVDVLNHLLNYHHEEIACMFSFFNYGDSIRLFNDCADDCFVSDRGTINYMRVLQSKDDIFFNRIMQDKHYGDWAYVSLEIDDTTVSNVVMTPLALMNFRENQEYLIFVQFVSQTHFLNVIFAGTAKEEMIIRRFPNNIATKGMVGISRENPGRFWQPYNTTKY